MIKEISELNKDEISKLLYLIKGVELQSNDKDEVLISLKEQGFIDSDRIKYSFTSEGEQKTQGFIVKYSEIIKDMVRQYGESVATQVKIEDATGLPGLIIETLARYQGITFLP